ncbi:MAG TPA: hypothetical protein VM008_18625 [Phycisphaerae bacterium]|nr:hypothetical protein [Phycisphaerae bacterium]
MSVSVPLSPELEGVLRRRAAELGKDPAILASELLANILSTGALTRERLEAISADAHEQFKASGMTDDQLADELERIKHASRAASRGITFHE